MKLVGMTVGRSMAKTATGGSGGSSDIYLFREKEEEELQWHGVENVFLKREDLGEVHDKYFGDAVRKVNDISGENSPAYQAKLMEYIALKEERKERRKIETKGMDKEEKKMWDSENKAPRKPRISDYRKKIDVDVVEYFKESELFHENYSMEFIPRLGSQEDYNVMYQRGEKTGRPTGLTEGQAIENRRNASKILERFAERWEEEFPNLKFYSGVVHNDRVSTHSHMKVVPVADYSDAKAGYKGPDKAPGFHRALRQMGYEPNLEEIIEYKKKNGLNVDEITDKDRDYSTFVQFKKRADEVLKECANEFGWDREIKGVKNSGKTLEHDMYKKNIAAIETKLDDNLSLKNEKLVEMNEIIDDKKLELRTYELYLGDDKPKKLDGVWKPAVSNSNEEFVSSPAIKTISSYDIEHGGRFKKEQILKREGLKKVPSGKVQVDEKDWDELVENVKNAGKKVKHYKEFSEKTLVEYRKLEKEQIETEMKVKDDLSYRNQCSDLRWELKKERRRNGYEKLDEVQRELQNVKRENTGLKMELEFTNEENKELKVIKKAALYLYEKIENTPLKNLADRHFPQLKGELEKERERKRLEEKRIRAEQEEKQRQYYRSQQQEMDW